MSFSRLLLLLGAATQVAGFAPVGLALRRVGSLNRHAAVHCGAVRQVNTAEFEEAIQVCELSQVPVSKVPASKVPVSKVPVSKVSVSKVPVSELAAVPHCC